MTIQQATNVNEQSSKSLAEKGLHAAQKFLENRGHTILDINWKSKAGSIDLVSREENTLCFSIVQIRQNIKGFPKNTARREKLEEIAQDYLTHHCDIGECRVRFDCISILVLSDSRALVRYHTNCQGTTEEPDKQDGILISRTEARKLLSEIEEMQELYADKSRGDRFEADDIAIDVASRVGKLLKAGL